VDTKVEEERIGNDSRYTHASIDIFPIDGTPNNGLLRKIYFFRVLYHRALMSLCYKDSIDRNRKRSKKEIKRVNERFAELSEELNKSNTEKEKITQEIKEFLMDNDNRQELETITPFVLKESGETKFRQCFELLYPLFLPRLREKVPSTTRREELLSMLIVLKQNNKEIAELLAIAPRSVLMLRHRFRQKIGMNTEYSLEYFIEELLDVAHSAETTPEENSNSNE
jgi:DNA-binding CsgD family transcriptional regulator